MGGWRSWCSLFFHFQTGQISEVNGERRQNLRTLPAEIAWKTRCCFVYGKPQFSGSRRTSHFYHGHNVSNLLLVKRIGFKSNLTSAHHLISWLHGACADQELPEAIKKLEEEVLERAWRCGCHITAPMPGGSERSSNHVQI